MATNSRRLAKLLALAVWVFFPTFSSAAGTWTFGDVVITVEAEPEGSASHGYQECRFIVINRNRTANRLVRLTFPADHQRSSVSHLRAVSKTVDVGPEATVRVSLFVPAFPPAFGSNLEVAINGRAAEGSLPYTLRTVDVPGRRSYSYGAVGAHEGEPPLALLGPSLRAGGWREVAVKKLPAPSGGPGGLAPGALRPGGPVAGGGVATQPRMQYAAPEGALSAWPTSWLGYSRYDGVFLSQEDLAGLTPASRLALWQYAEAGGVLLVLGQAALPESWRSTSVDKAGFRVFDAGFGLCLVAGNTDFKHWNDHQWEYVETHCVAVANSSRNMDTLVAAHAAFPVVDDVNLPVGALFIVLVGFVILIGPVNMLLLGRFKRRIWLLWTVPVASLTTCAAVFVSMAIAEGWSGHLRTDGVTLLDEATHRATTLGVTAFYCPLTPSDGLHFSPDTELTLQASDVDYYSRRTTNRVECELDWSTDQHLSHGWISPRVPSHFLVRKCEVRRERLPIRRGKDGTLTLVNGLGADIHVVWYADEKGQLFKAEDVAAGADAVLHETPDPKPPTQAVLAPTAAPARSSLKDKRPVALHRSGLDHDEDKALPNAAQAKLPDATMRTLYLSARRMALTQKLRDDPRSVLKKNAYLAELDDAPFIEDGLRSVKTRACRSVVVGLNKKPDEE